ncbi:MAG: two component LuxR family transcriptional regulator [Puniceicoccaceae bacterium 5H]|nr:MAG: two component LuxR family transcriptional regulator [Puniceicoccaceae bacterium 5H]
MDVPPHLELKDLRKEVAQRQRQLDAWDRLAKALMAGDGPGADRLSGREREVFAWLEQGKSSQEVARVLGISPRTVEKHVQAIYKKLGVSQRHEIWQGR